MRRRWTIKNNKGVLPIKPLDPDCGNCNFETNARCKEHLSKMLKTLAEYENTGLSPKRIMELKESVREPICNEDCFNCIYEDCINPDPYGGGIKGMKEAKEEKETRKVKENTYYQKNKERALKQARKQYAKKKAEKEEKNGN